MQKCARAVLVTPDGLILLIKIAVRGGLWITPGGRIKLGETALEALRRELREETGRDNFEISAELWSRHASFQCGGQTVVEHERFFLVRTERFEPSIALMEPEELALHPEFRWWSAREISASDEASSHGASQPCSENCCARDRHRNLLTQVNSGSLPARLSGGMRILSGRRTPSSHPLRAAARLESTGGKPVTIILPDGARGMLHRRSGCQHSPPQKCESLNVLLRPALARFSEGR
jgi:ADP-ribose pyrophosphatase YjhB (NUDIX family)